jgi:ribosomal protein S12 methylthiotransferase
MPKIRVNLTTLGCAKNQVDSERLLGILSGSGYQLVEKREDADILILNTCGFIDSAKRESLDEIWDLISLKDQKKKLIICGCLVQRYPKELAKEIPEIDGILGISDIHKIDLACKEVLKNKRVSWVSHAKREDQKTVRRVLFQNGSIRTNPTYAYLRIADGCDNRCSYCAIPNIRGRYISRSIKSILREAKYLAEKGVKEINLVAQDTTLFGVDLYNKKRLPELLNLLSEISGIEWIRLLYTHPAHYSDELIETMAKNPKVCKYLDLPLQHISDDILSRMNRKVSREQIERLIDKLKEKIPDLTLRTTFLVGFPGEKEKDFQKLLAFVEQTEFDRLGAFAYSKEEDTSAYDFANQVSSKIKLNRLDRLLLLQQTISQKKNRKKIRRVFKVLIEGKSEGGYFMGRSQGEAPEVDGVIYVRGDKIKLGNFVEVRITEANECDLFGNQTGLCPSKTGELSNRT